MVGNIRGSDITSGSVIAPYFPPFPMRGFGALRYVFVLYKQDAEIDFSALAEVDFDDPTTAFARRSFSSYQFLRQHQDILTPAALLLPIESRRFRQINLLRQTRYEGTVLQLRLARARPTSSV